jgi:hypothetical protein
MKKIFTTLNTLAVTLFVLAALMLPVGAVQAQSSCGSNTTVGDETALDNAITDFNNGGAGCDFTITLTADISLSASTPLIDNSGAGSQLLIDGSGHTVNGQGLSGVRPFDVAANSVVTLSQITLTGGSITYGGGLRNFGNTTIKNSTISANSGGTSGGAIYNAGTLVVDSSTLSGNQAAYGGAVDNEQDMTLTNSTISGNHAQNTGGAITSYGPLTVTNSTFSGNSALFADGINTGAVLNLTNSIIANNSTGGDCRVSGSGSINAAYNLIQDTGASACSLSSGTNNNIIGQDPNLSALQDNGGPTQTHALLAGSPAIDAADNAVCAAAPVNGLDQRGVARPFGSQCDIGAYEYVVAPPALSIDDVSMLEGDSGTQNMVFTITASHAYPQNIYVGVDARAGTATTADGDYVQMVGYNANIPAGFTSTTFSVTINGDTKVEGDETFTVDLTNPINATLADAQGVGTILNDDVAPPTLSIDDVSMLEGDSGTQNMVFTISASHASSQDIAVDVHTQDGTATTVDGDYALLAQHLEYIHAGSTSTTVSVTINGDTKVEGDETFTVNLDIVIGDATLADGVGVGTILNDDLPPPAPSITTQPQDTTIFSGQAATLTVTASGSSLSYQWYQGTSGDTSTPVGTDSASFTTPALTTDTSYWVRVSNPGGNADSDTATVTVQGAPVITTQPQSQIIASGQTADLSVVASGSSLSYQWYQGVSGDTSTPVGTDSASFTTPALTADTSYWVRVSNPAGNADSDTATVTVTTQGGEQVITLLDSQGGGLAGATAQYYLSGWHDIPGSTGSDGKLSYAALGLSGNLTFRISYAHASIQKKQNIDNDPKVVFQTTLVSMKLLASDGTTELNGTAEYYASGWNTFGSGTTTTSMELLPTNYTFRVSYGGASVQKKQDVSSDPNVVFQTTLVSMKLLDSTGAELAGTSSYYASGWKTFGSGTTTTSMELLPTNYTFRVSYGGASVQKKQDVSTDPNVVFQTTVVSMKLLASDGTTELNGTAEYYAGGWNTFGSGSTTTSMELLPTNYTFRVSYGGASVQKKQDVSSDPNVVFNTVLVSMKLLDSTGAELTGTPSYYASGWKTFGSGTTTTSMELLPTNYTFRVSYGGASVQKKQDVSSDPNVVFQTVAVHSDSGTATQYYAGGWQTFTQDMELLPGGYPFRFSDGTPQTAITLTEGGVNHIH